MDVSVIIPAYNAKKTIANCLDSLSSQNYKGKYEIIVVDDGSKDATKQIAGNFAKVKLLMQNHAGPAKARNLGAKNAKGEILIFTDSDCIADKNFISEMAKPFSNREIAGVQGRYKCRQKELIARLIHLEIEERYEHMQKQKYIDFIGSYAAAYRKNEFLKAHGFDASFPMASGEDTDLSFRLSAMGKKMVFAQKAIVWHTHPISLWKYLKVKYFRAFWRALIYKKHRDKIAGDSYTSQKMKAQLGLFYLLVLSLIGSAFYWLLAYAALAFFILFLLSTVPFALWAAKRDLSVGIIVPITTLLRTAAFSIGLIAGALRVMGMRN